MSRAGGGEQKRRTSKRDLERTSSEVEEKWDRVLSQRLVIEVSQAQGSDKSCEMLLVVK